MAEAPSETVLRELRSQPSEFPGRHGTKRLSMTRSSLARYILCSPGRRPSSVVFRIEEPDPDTWTRFGAENPRAAYVLSVRRDLMALAIISAPSERKPEFSRREGGDRVHH
nr:hypothetical protein CFP56_64731 [Quercus suber]